MFNIKCIFPIYFIDCIQCVSRHVLSLAKVPNHSPISPIVGRNIPTTSVYSCLVLQRVEHKKGTLLVFGMLNNILLVDIEQTSIIYISVCLVYRNKECWLSFELTYQAASGRRRQQPASYSRV